MQVIYVLILLTLILPESAHAQTCGFFGDDCRQPDTKQNGTQTAPPVPLVTGEYKEIKEENLPSTVADRIKSLDFKRSSKLATDEAGIFLYGLDIVSIYNGGAHSYGKIRYSAAWNGGIWLFNSEQNMSLFIENPMKYIPAYGGYCAFDMANGKVVPATILFYIHDRKLYLFNTKGRRQSWLENIPRHIAVADALWNNLDTSSLTTLEPSPAAKLLSPLLK